MSGFGAPALTVTSTPARARSTRLSITLPICPVEAGARVERHAAVE
jgi:hypothetical protein